MSDFRVITMGLPAIVEDRLRASSAPESALPSLTEVDRQHARVHGIDEQDSAREALAHRYAREREEREGRLLGDRVVELLGELGPIMYCER